MLIRDDYLKLFNYWEIKHKVFNFKIKGIAIWQYIRLEIYNRIYYKLVNGQWNINLYPKIEEKKFFQLIKNMCMDNPFFFSKKEVLIINDIRREKIEDTYISPYLDGMLDNLNLSYIVLEPQKREVRTNKVETKKLLYYAPEYFFIDGEINENDKKRLLSLISSLEKEFEVNLTDIEKITIVKAVGVILASRIRFRLYYNFILNQIKPKVLVIFRSSGFIENTFLIELAKEKGIKTVSVADGIVTPEFYLTLQNNGKLTDKQDKELLVSKYFKCYPEYLFCQLILGEYRNIPNIVEVGNAYNNKRVKSFSKKLRDKQCKTILVMSDWFSDSKLPEFSKYIAEHLPAQTYKVVFKLHPADTNWRYKYPCLVDSRVKVVGMGYTKDIYNYLAEADYYVGLGTTVLCQAVPFHRPIFILNSTYVEDTSYMYLYEHNYARLINDKEEFINLITNQDEMICTMKNKHDIWPENPAELFNQALQNIINS